MKVSLNRVVEWLDMKTKNLLCAAMIGLGLAAAAPAHAGVRVSIGLPFPFPPFLPPPPVVVAPAPPPVVYSPPPAVVYTPPPAYCPPPAVVVQPYPYYRYGYYHPYGYGHRGYYHGGYRRWLLRETSCIKGRSSSRGCALFVLPARALMSLQKAFSFQNGFSIVNRIRELGCVPMKSSETEYYTRVKAWIGTTWMQGSKPAQSASLNLNSLRPQGGFNRSHWSGTKEWQIGCH
jgi:hypothetical protein